jgi:hypothetical protein
VAQEAGQRGSRIALAVELRVGVGLGFVGLVGAPFTAPVLGITPVIAAVLAANALVSRPRLNWVPSTLKCSPDSRPLLCAISTVASNSSMMTSRSIIQSRFLLNTEWFHTASSIDSPTNQRKSRL